MATCEICNSNRSARFISGINFCNDCFDNLQLVRSGDKKASDYFVKYLPTSSKKAAAYIKDIMTSSTIKTEALEEARRKQAENDAAAAQLQQMQIERIRQEKDEQLIIQNNYVQAQNIPLNERLMFNDLFEYKTVYLRDSANGMLDQNKLDETLLAYASQGWHLKSVFTNEAGKNAVSFGSVGINSTIDVTILIFERCIRRAIK